ncbi:MAG: PUA domain-containing protein [Sulfolobales archaeon]
MKMYYLSKKDLKTLQDELKRVYKLQRDFERIFFVDASDHFRNKSVNIYIALSDQKIPLVIKIDNVLLPAIHSLNRDLLKIPYVKVDKGAVPRILNGADVMAPGIIELSEFNIGEIVGVKEPDNSLYIAVGKSLMSSVEISVQRKGKAIKNLHYAGDDIWKILIELLKKI